MIVSIKNHTDLVNRREKTVKRVNNYFLWYYHPATGEAWIDNPKNGHGRMVRLPHKALQLMGELLDVGALFRTPKGLPYVLRQSGGGQMQAAFNKARDAAGLGSDVTPHVLRHSWATWYYAQTRDFGGLTDLGGWMKSDMANRYRKIAPADLADRLLAHGWNFDFRNQNTTRTYRANSVPISGA